MGSILVLGFFCANTLPLYAHLARAGDADSLYLMLFTFAMLAMLEIRKNHKFLYVCGLCFALAFLTKSWHAGIIAAIGGIYLLLTGEILKIKLKEWVLFAASALVPLLLWFGWRYQADGFTFLRQMVEVDLLARTGTDNFEGHSFPFDFYWDMVFGNTAYIYPWVTGICGVGLLAGISAGAAKWKQKALDREEGNLFMGLILWFGITFLGFSAMKTKLIWYCYPAIVPLFVGAALFLGRLIEKDMSEKDGKIKNPGQIKAAAQILLAAGCIFLTAHFMKVTYDTAIGSVHGDSFQDFLQISAQQDSPYAGAEAYIQVAGEKPEQLGDWDQNRLFLAEISGNFHCLDGGAEAFLQAEEGSVLYLDRENYVKYQEQLAGYETVYLNPDYPYVLIQK